MSEKRFDPEGALKLDDPGRLEWMPPGRVLEALRVRPGMTVADVGAGTGYFTLQIAAAVGPAGRVIAVDAQDAMLDHLRAKLKLQGAPANVVAVRAEADATGVPPGSCDAVLLANVWHEFEDFGRVLREVGRILVPSGRLVILDWDPRHRPPPGPPFDHRLSASHASEALAAAGWLVEGTAPLGAFLWTVVGSRPA